MCAFRRLPERARAFPLIADLGCYRCLAAECMLTSRALLALMQVNHFPGTWGVGRKDRLCRNLARMKRDFPEDYDIAATTYLLPSDRRKFIQEMEEDPKVSVIGSMSCRRLCFALTPCYAAVFPSTQSIWILKPPASSCGRGIYLVSKAAGSILPKPQKALIAQRYIKHPLLINGYKFDMRIYAMVTSFDPLKVYLFHNGLTRCVGRWSPDVCVLKRPSDRLSRAPQVLHGEVHAVVQEPEEPLRALDELQREQAEREV